MWSIAARSRFASTSASTALSAANHWRFRPATYEVQAAPLARSTGAPATRRASADESLPHGRHVLAVPGDGPFEAFLQSDLRGPTSMGQFRDVEEFLRSTIWFCCVPVCFTRIADNPGDRVGDLVDRDVRAAADVDVVRPIVVLKQVQAGVSHVVSM